MSGILVFAMVSILLAAALYTIAVFSERVSRVLKPWHLALFWAGFIFDTAGTTLMAEIAGGMRFDVHGVTGMAAIAVMLAHSVWASIAMGLKQESVLRSFHRFSIAVWALWMFALVSGFAMVIFGWE